MRLSRSPPHGANRGRGGEFIAQALNKRGIEMKIKHVQSRLGDVKRNYSDTSTAKKMLGWEPEVELGEGIERTIDYFRRERKITRESMEFHGERPRQL